MQIGTKLHRSPLRAMSRTNSNGSKSKSSNKIVVNHVIRTEEILHMKRRKIWRWIQSLRLLSPMDFLYSTDLTALWRRHLVWSKDSKELLEIVTNRFASTQIFLSLLFAAEVGTYFSPSRIVTDVRNALRTGPTIGSPLEYATGIVLILSIILTGSAVLANYTAMGVFKTLSCENAATILRSDVGLYAATLPSRLTFLAILTFFAWNCMFWWVNVQGYYRSALALTIVCVSLIAHVIQTFSAMSRIIMNTSAMGHTPILPKGTEEQLLPHELTNVLLTESHIANELKTPVNYQYRNNFQQNETVWTYESSLRHRHPEIKLEDVHGMVDAIAGES